jgi:hypothetical protein
MVGIPFHISALAPLKLKRPEGRSGPAVYACGQPMGAYSSWAVFSLCHHIVVRIASKRSGSRVTPIPYILLGDDIVIRNNGIAKAYLAILKDIGVGISDAKTHVSKNMYEFAKRWYVNGVEVTGVPVRAFSEVGTFW